jgi:hypothetical protein
MFPGFARENRTDCTGVHTKLPCKHTDRFITAPSNDCGIGCSQLRPTVTLTAGGSTLRHSICNVVCMGAKFEMRRLAASRIVAAVTHDEPCGMRWRLHNSHMSRETIMALFPTLICP